MDRALGTFPKSRAGSRARRPGANRKHLRAARATTSLVQSAHGGPDPVSDACRETERHALVATPAYQIQALDKADAVHA